MTDYGPATEAKINEVIGVCDRYGHSSIVALAGVPGTGKSFIAEIAAQRIASDPCMVKEIQFHQTFPYEEFIEGMRIDTGGGVMVKPGIFLEWNQQALEDPDHQYVLLIEELTRANLSAVLGELMTYVEYRDRYFTTLYSRQGIQVAENLTILATYNPTDRSAIDLDAALLRRLRIIEFLPSAEQLEEMFTLKGSDVVGAVLEQLRILFAACEKEAGSDYKYLMPFGHGIFADVKQERPDLNELWRERIVHLLRRPFVAPHRLTEVIEEHYPWRTSPDYELAGAAAANTPDTGAGMG